MSKELQVLKIEIKQNILKYFSMFFMSLAVGVGIVFLIYAVKFIEENFILHEMPGQLIALPKGVDLIDFQRDLLDGKAEALLPEALFKTSQDLFKGEVKIQALLPIKDQNQSSILVAGDEFIWGDFFSQKVNFKPWQEQHVYSTNEWSNHVIEAMIFSAPYEKLVDIKNILERKTVAQAFLLSEVYKKNESYLTRSEIILLGLYGVFLVLVTIIYVLIYKYLNAQLLSLKKYIDTMGLSVKKFNLWFLGFVIALNLLPLVIIVGVALSFV